MKLRYIKIKYIYLLFTYYACLAGVKNFLVFAKKTDIRVISLDVNYYADVVLPVGELRNTIAVDVDRKEGEVKVAR